MAFTGSGWGRGVGGRWRSVVKGWLVLPCTGFIIIPLTSNFFMYYTCGLLYNLGFTVLRVYFLDTTFISVTILSYKKPDHQSCHVTSSFALNVVLTLLLAGHKNTSTGTSLVNIEYRPPKSLRSLTMLVLETPC